MTLTTPETPQAGEKAPDQNELETQKQLAKAKLEAFLKMSPVEMIQNYFKEREKLTPDQRREMLKAMVFSFIFTKLGVKPKPNEESGDQSAEGSQTESDTQSTEATAEPKKPEKDERSAGKQSAATPPLPPVDTAKYKSGDLLPAIIGLYPGVEVQGALQPFANPPASKRHGVPQWNKKTTDNWDYAGAGNTDEAMEKGEYQIQSVPEPKDYTRKGTDNVPGPTLKKLVKIAELLRADPRMPLFTGIAMTVDGVQVMFVKEIHIHRMIENKTTGEWEKSDPSLSDHYYRPHTGVSYVMKKTS